MLAVTSGKHYGKNLPIKIRETPKKKLTKNMETVVYVKKEKEEEWIKRITVLLRSLTLVTPWTNIPYALSVTILTHSPEPFQTVPQFLTFPPFSLQMNLTAIL